MRAAAHRIFAVDAQSLAWAAAAILIAAAAGLLVARQPSAAFDAGAIGVCAAVAARRPYVSLLALMLVRATLANSVLFDFVVLGAGAIALLAVAPTLPAKRLSVPLILFLLVALPSVPLLPSWDEGTKAAWLQLPLVHFSYARNPSAELLEWIRLATVLVAFCWAALSVRGVDRLRGVVAAIIASAAYPIVSGLLDMAAGGTVRREGGFGSIEATFNHPNAFAAYLVVVLVIAVVAFIETRTLAARVGIGLIVAGGIVCLYSTYTRGAWIAFAAALVIVAALHYRRLVVVGAIGLALAVLLAPAATHKAQQRFADLSASSASFDQNSWKWRTEQWSRMVPWGLHRPVLGAGFGSFSRDTVEVFGVTDPQFSTLPGTVGQPLGFVAHNDYVKSLVETGIVGLVLWVLILTGLVAVSLRARRIRGAAPYAAAGVAIGVVYIGMGVSDNIEASAASLIYGFVLAGALAGVASGAKPSGPAPAVPAVAPAELPESEAPAELVVEVTPEPAPEPPPSDDAPAEPVTVRRRSGGLVPAAARWLGRRRR